VTPGPKGYEVLFHRLASEEYLRARRWYAQQGGNALAERFRNEVEAAVEMISRDPHRWPRFRDKYRSLRLDRFPYLLYYTVLDDSRVLVLAVAHSSRRPGYWLQRSPG
jgi:plasmid stabilization system protein ParE